MVLNIIESEGSTFRKIILSGKAPDDTGWLLHHDILKILRGRQGERLLVDITAVQGRSNEVVLSKRGIPVRLFFGEDEATKWLVE